MPRFEYKGRDTAGQSVGGVLDATNETEVARQLIRTGISPVVITLYEEKRNFITKFFSRVGFDYPGLEDLAFFSRQMYSLTRSGVPIVRALQVVSESSKNAKLKLALADVVVKVKEGQSLGGALRQYPAVFPALLSALVGVGENTGRLDEVFKQITFHYERELITRRQILSAIRYPITVLIVIAVAIMLINFLVIPAFSNFFEKFGGTLPLPTRILIGFSYFTIHYWYLVLVAIGTLIFFISAYLKTSQGRYAWDHFKLSIPVIGGIIRRGLLARFLRSFAITIRSGIPLLDAISIVSKTTDNVYIGEHILTMRSHIEKGESITLAATASGMFTPLVLQMLMVGEETGEMDRLLDEVAEHYELQVDYDVKRLGDSLEPMLILLIAGIVLLLALGVFLPMWDISKVALGKSV